DGFSFRQAAYDPPLAPRRPELPRAVDGRNHPVDRLVGAYFAEHQIEPPGAVADAAFLRRAHLDAIGLLPTPEKLSQFLADPRGDSGGGLRVDSGGGLRVDKRALLVQDLLTDDVAYAEHWLTFFNDLLRNDYTGTGFITGGRKQITTWLYRALVENMPYDRLVRELIAPSPDSEGFIQGIRWRGDVSASQSTEVQFAQSISQSFLGINMKCASCHDSFIDHWKLADAYGLAAIYAAEPLAIFRCDKPTGQHATPGWIFPELGQVRSDAPQAERLRQLAALMTHPANGRFTRTIVNRIWQRLMGRGIVHPLDAMHTQPWSEDLLDYLAVDLADHGYDLKHTIELICTSQAYQARIAPVAEPERGGYVFRGPLARRLSAEQFVDAVWQITGAGPDKPDAAVFRGRAPPASSANPTAGADRLRGQWIWSYAEASAVSPAGEAIAVRRLFELPMAPERAVAAVTCDNEYTLYANGRKVQSDGNWETVEAVDLGQALRPGMNELVIVAKNGGGAPNPAGLFFEARLRLPGGAEQTIASDAAWQWTRSLPDGRGEFRSDPADWQPAVTVANSAVWTGRVGEACLAVFAQTANGPPRMVRASLMKSDVLMRSLGRPNRDQIVTLRPNDLTTLEAIDLANGQVLADTLERGARNVVARTDESADELTTWLFRFALSRPPTELELTLAREALGSRVDEHGIEDLMWSVFMLPEFQLVR
ncbi:MAG TPA: DUF1549 domain-containing protein, partial [Pirellulales bacterium]|nr:DUF1549 domain-containing protein [Pirellulales bacterium]